MRFLQIGMFCTIVLCTGALGGAEQDTLSLSSYARARAVLDAGLQAMGGAEALMALNTVTRELRGTRTDEGQGLVPSDSSHNQPYVFVVIDLRTPRTAITLRDVIQGGQPLHFKFVVTPADVISGDHVYKTLRTSKASAVSALPQLRRYPEGLLRAAYTRPETLRWIGESTVEGRKQEVIAFADADGVSVDLSFDAQTHLLTKSETLRADPLLGDGTVEILFSDYRPVGAVKLPFRYTERQAGATLQHLIAASLTTDSAAADAFSPPSDYTRVEPKPPDPVVKLAENVYAIMGDYNSVAIAFPDHIVVLEGGSNGRAAQNAIDLIRKTILGKRIRYVIATHFHFDHLGGIRTYIAEGATVVTTASAKHVLESRGLAAKHTIRPDRLAQNPSTATIEVVDKRRVFVGGGMRLEVIDVGPSPHVKEMLIGYLPAQKVLFQADLLDLPPDAETPVAGDDTRDLAAKIERLGLDVERIVSVHGRLGTVGDLRRSVAATR